MKTTALALSVLLVSASLFAQENGSEEAIKYSNITEFGFFTGSPKSFAFEGTTVNGFSIDKRHCIGLGIGMGFSFHSDYYEATSYMPVFLNYRVYLNPDKVFTPHVNIAIGGVMVEDGFGIYSSLTAGFRAGKFSFSSGLSCMPVYRETYVYSDYWDYDGSYYGRNQKQWKWFYPFGLVVKCGFSF
ncbi:MAG: hypothetical protein FWH36_08200 [Lentimicrobiaceae bacterium]|nr:hypothetical protein [Lentimicrobiaceae bacterium]